MARILQENANNDLEIQTNNQLGILTGIEAVSQACASAVETQRGELRFAQTTGVPTDQTVWGGVANRQLFAFYAVEAIKRVVGVQEVTQFDSDIVGDVLVYNVVIVTDFGTTTIGSLFDGV